MVIIAERLSARHVIAEYCVEIVCLYIYIYVTLRNAISPYGEAHTVVLYARARGQQLQGPGIARSFITTRRSFITRLQNERFAFPSRFPCTALISNTVTDAARTRALAREGKRRQRELEERHHCYSVKT